MFTFPRIPLVFHCIVEEGLGMVRCVYQTYMGFWLCLVQCDLHYFPFPFVTFFWDYEKQGYFIMVFRVRNVIGNGCMLLFSLLLLFDIVSYCYVDNFPSALIFDF